MKLQVEGRPILEILLVLTVVFTAVGVPPVAAQAPAPAGVTITFPADIMADFSIVSAQSVTFAGSADTFLVVGYAPREFDPAGKVKSFMGIYRRIATGFDEVYRFLPVPKADYPMPLNFENLWAVQGAAPDGRLGTVALATSWGETGADYWGTHPIIFTYTDGSFKAVPLYTKNLADDPRIKGSSWTQPDFDVSNAFDPKDSVKTILAQRMSVSGNVVTLTFFGDNECKACEHRMVDIELPLGG